MNNSSESIASLVVSSLGWIILVVAALVFFLFGQPYYYKKGYEQGAADRHAYDMQRVQQRYNLPNDGALDAVSGRIKEIRGNVMVVETAEQPINPLLDPYPVVREITVTEQTVVKARRLKTEAELARDANDPEALPFVESDATIAALAVGDEVMVTSADESISYAQSFIAKEVFKNATPTSAAPTR